MPDEPKTDGPTPTDRLLQVYLQEYGKLKDEQTMRIKFRDGMIPLALAAVGALVPFALAKEEHLPALLLIPIICVILGWSYITNDEKVSHLGWYLRVKLGDWVAKLIDAPPDQVLHWEVWHRSDDRRPERKRTQLMVDLLTFVFPGLLATGLYAILTWQKLGNWSLVSIPFAVPSVWLMVMFIRYSDSSKGK